MLEVHRHSTAAAFLDRAEHWLAANELEHAGLYASARQARVDDSLYQQPVYWATIEANGEIVGCAYRTPPYNVGITELPAAAIEPLVANLREIYRTVSGFSGPDAAASAAARAWTARQGGTLAVRSRQRRWSAATIEMPANLATGALRTARREDAGVLQAWGDACARETGIGALDGSFCVRLMRASQIFLWDDGRPRAMAGVIRRTAQGAAIGIVYTSIEWRRQGYAQAAVATLAHALLARAPRCHLHVDAASMPVNALAQKLGFTATHETVDIDVR